MKVGSRSPWGTVDNVIVLAPGIEAVSTARHGGIHLDRKHSRKLPEAVCGSAFLGNRTWFEEDCDWCIPFVAFEAEILDHADDTALAVIGSRQHRDALQRNHPSLVGKIG